MSSSKQKRKLRAQVAQTFGGSRNQMLQMSQKASNSTLSPKNSNKRSSSKGRKSDKVKRSSSKHGKHGKHGKHAQSFNLSGSEMSESEELWEKVVKPGGDPKKWNEEKVLTWLQWLSQIECYHENDRSLSDEERKNFKLKRLALFRTYFEKFINADMDGKKLFKMDNNSLRNSIYMNNALDRKIVVKALEELFGDRKVLQKASEYKGTDNYDFSRDWKKSDRSEREWQKRKAAAGNISKMTLAEIGSNANYHGTEWTKDIDDMTTGDVLADKTSKFSKNFGARRQKVNLKKQTVSEIGVAENYVIPEYADAAIAETMKGQATDERLTAENGMDINETNRELVKILLHANINIPPELLTPVKGYHTIQNRNAQLRNLLLKEQALMSERDIELNPELKRAAALKSARKKFEQEQNERENEALRSGDLKKITKTYGRNHKKIRQIKEIMKEKEKIEKRIETGRKYRHRHRQNESSLALLKKKKKKKTPHSSSLALTEIAKTRNKETSSSSHSRKRSNSIGHNISKLDPDNLKSGQPKRPVSAGGYIRGNNRRDKSQTMGFAPNKPKHRKRSSSKSKKKKNKDGVKKKVSFMAMDHDKAPTREKKMRKKGKRKGKKKKLEDNPSLDSTRSDDSFVSNGTVIIHSEDTPKSMPGDGPGLSLSPNSLDLSYDASVESANPTPQSSRYDVMATPICEDEEQDDMGPTTILNDDISMERTHSLDSRSVVIHDLSEVQVDTHKRQQSLGGSSSASSSSFETSWHDDDDDHDHDHDDEMKGGGNNNNVNVVVGMTKLDEESSSSEITFSDDDNENDDDDGDDDGGTVPLSVQLLRAQEKKEKEKEKDKDTNKQDKETEKEKVTENETNKEKFAPPMPRLMSEISEE